LEVLTKGSPEAIGKLLKVRPEGYEKMYTSLVKDGMRVIALARRDITSASKGMSEATLVKQQRDWAEQELTLVGFVAFRCLMRQDSPKVPLLPVSCLPLVTLLSLSCLSLSCLSHLPSPRVFTQP
jgi:magnesium-transporting ATPase (P-type)